MEEGGEIIFSPWRCDRLRRVRYDGLPPEPPLTPETGAWLDALLREKDLRAG